MAGNLQPVARFVKGSNPAESWKRWKTDFNTYRLALKYHTEDEAVQIALFLQVCGEELKRKYDTFNFEPLCKDTKLTLDDVIATFDKQFEPYKNLELASFVFWNLKQEEGQSFDDFLTTITLQAQQCCFGDATERNVKDKIFHGIRDVALRERLLLKPAWTLEKLIDYCKTAEISRSHASDMVLNTEKQPNSSSVEAIHMQRTKIQREYRTPQRDRPSLPNSANRSVNRNENKSCFRCGTTHPKFNCPAGGTRCNFCGKPNHWEKVCKQKSSLHKSQINNVEAEGEDSEEVVYLGELHVDHLQSEGENEWLEDIDASGHKLTVKLDTGAQVNVISSSVFDSWVNKPSILPTKIMVSTYTGERLSVIGKCTLLCRANERQAELPFVVIKDRRKSLLGLSSCRDLGLIIRARQQRPETVSMQCKSTTHKLDLLAREVETPLTIVQEYRDVFEGIGCLPGKYHIVLREDAIPSIVGPRVIPQSIEKAVIQELKVMEKQKIIVKEEEPTDWVSNLLIVRKNGKIRLCLDPQKLNKAIKRPHYKIPSARELINRLSGTKLFSLFDAKKGFWHLKLDEESSKLTTFITPFGRYRFLRMPFGLNCAPEAFQLAMDRLFEQEPDINPYFDDILLGANNMKEHCIQIRRLLEIARKTGLKLNPDKSQLAVTSVQYLGHTLTEQGMAPDRNKLEAVANFPTPQNKDDIRRFLGMATYLMQYVPQFSDCTLPLRTLLKKDVCFLWDANMQTAFEKLKDCLIDPPVLSYFDPQQPIVISADASSYGVGSVLLQQGRPVAYASAALTTTQQKYAQVEKELVAVVFALEKFHYYVYGRETQVETDHKPLVGLVDKPYHTASPRLQKLLMRWQKYQASLVYVPGKELAVADALSRAPLSKEEVQTADNEDLQVCMVARITDQKLVRLQNETATDRELMIVINWVQKGWPEEKAEVQSEGQPYWPYRTELHYIDGLLCRGGRLVIPKTMRKEVLEALHKGHRGIVACKNKARQAVYWPGLNQQVEQTVLACSLCQQFQNQSQKEPIYMEEGPPLGPWQKLSIDFFSHRQRTYMLVIDNFSKYPELIQMTQTIASHVNLQLYKIYSHHGFPLQVITDNGPPFNSKEFETFNKTHGIIHVTSSPLYPRSNGQVERAVQTIKRALDKSSDDETSLNTILFDFRTTPTDGLPSPAEALMGRKLRSFYPMHPKLLKPAFACAGISKSLWRRKYAQNKQGDQHSMPLTPLACGDSIWFWTGQQWSPGKILRLSKFPRSYIVDNGLGKEFRRNRVHVRPRILQFQEPSLTNRPSIKENDTGFATSIDIPKISPDSIEPKESDTVTQKATVVLQPKADQQTQKATVDLQPKADQQAYHTRSGREIRMPSRYSD